MRMMMRMRKMISRRLCDCCVCFIDCLTIKWTLTSGRGSDEKGCRYKSGPEHRTNVMLRHWDILMITFTERHAH